MESKIVTNDLTLYQYNNTLEHEEFLEKFRHDELTNKFFDEWESIAKESLTDESDSIYAYVVEIDGNLVGLISLCFINDTSAVFSQTILPEYRGRNYAGIVRKNVLDYLKSIGVENVVGYVKLENENIIRNLYKSGFNLKRVGNRDYFEVVYSEMENNNVR